MTAVDASRYELKRTFAAARYAGEPYRIADVVWFQRNQQRVRRNTKNVGLRLRNDTSQYLEDYMNQSTARRE